jgi:hypothetical protein
MERQFPWRVISVHKDPRYYSASTRISRRVQVCYPMFKLKCSTRAYCKSEIPPSLFLYDAFLVEFCVMYRDGWRISCNSSYLKFPKLHFGRSCNLRDGGGILFCSYTPTIHMGVAQRHSAIHKYQTLLNDQQCCIIACRDSRRHFSA